MPIWDRHCGVCDELFTVLCTYEKKEEPKECPYCGSFEGTYLLSTAALSRHSERLMTHKPDKGFNEVLDRIKERNPRTPLATGRNSGVRAMD